MKSFKAFLSSQEQINEGIVRKGAVAAYALQGKKHGDAAERHYRDAKNATSKNPKFSNADPSIEDLKKAVYALADGLLSTRQQIGSLSAQVTASSVLK